MPLNVAKEPDDYLLFSANSAKIDIHYFSRLPATKVIACDSLMSD